MRFTLVFILILIFVLPSVLSFGIRYLPGGIQPPFAGTIKIDQNYSPSQSFTASLDNLSGIGVSFKNPNLINKKDIKLEIYQDQNLLRSSILNGNQIADGNFVRFHFDQVINSKNQQYIFKLSAASVLNNEALEVFLTPNSEISFISLYKPAYFFTPIIMIYSSWINKFFQDVSFAVFYLLLCGLVVSLSFRKT